VPLPDAAARRAVLDIHLRRKGHELAFDPRRLIEATDALSARQIAYVAARAVEAMVAEANPELARDASTASRRADSYEIKTRPLRWRHFEPVLATTRPDTPPRELSRFENW